MTAPVIEDRPGGDLRSAHPMAMLARLIGCTPGQAYTVAVAAIAAVVLTIGGVIPVMRARGGPAGGHDLASAPVAPPDGAAASAAPAGSGVPAAPEGQIAAAPSAAFAPATTVRSGGAPAVATPTTVATAGVLTGTAWPAAASAPGPVAPALGSTAVFAKVGAPGAPDGIAVGADGTVYVATNNGTTQGTREASKVMTYDANGKAGRSYVITGQPADHAVGVTGLALDGRGGVVALDASTGRVVRIDLKSGAQRDYATLPNAAPCSLVVAASTCEPGVQDRAPLPTSAVFDRSGNLYVADAGQATIWRIPAGGGTPVAWYQASDLATGNGLSGLAFDGSGNLLVTSPQPVDVTALNGGLYRIPVQPNGSAGTRQLVAAFARGDAPAGVTVADGGFVVALGGANAVLVLDGSGKEVHRVAGADTKLDAPTGLAFAPNGTLLATNQAPATPDDWSILAVGIQ